MTITWIKDQKYLLTLQPKTLERIRRGLHPGWGEIKVEESEFLGVIYGG